MPAMWSRLKSLLGRRDRELAERELRRGAAEAEGPRVPRTGGALFDEPFVPTESIPGDDLPPGPPGD